MARYHAISRSVCQDHLLYLLNLPNKEFNRTVEPANPIAFPTDSDQQEKMSEVQGRIQATAFDQDNYGVWVLNPQSQIKTWILEASQNKHSS